MEMRRQQQGLSLIEVMIAVGLSLGLLTGIVQVFTNSDRSHQWSEAQSQVLESGQFAIDLLSKAISQRGFRGCSNPISPTATTPNSVPILSTGFPLTNLATQSLQGFSVAAADAAGTWTPARPTDIDNAITPRNDSDLISIFHTDDQMSTMAGNNLVDMTTANTLNVAAPALFPLNSWAMISDCGATPDTILFQVAAIAGNTLTFNTDNRANTIPSRGFYQENSQIRPAFVDVFYVDFTGRFTQSGDAIFALFRSRNGGMPEELVEGVEFLRIEYGEQLANGNIRYISANTAPDMTQVKSVRIGILVSSTTAALPANDPNSYRLPGASAAIMIANRNLHRAFTKTIQLKTNL